MNVNKNSSPMDVELTAYNKGKSKGLIMQVEDRFTIINKIEFRD